MWRFPELIGARWHWAGGGDIKLRERLGERRLPLGLGACLGGSSGSSAESLSAASVSRHFPVRGGTTYWVALVLDLFRSDSTRIALVAENVAVQIFLVVDLADNLCETPGRKDAVGFAGLERADTNTLAQDELLTESS